MNVIFAGVRLMVYRTPLSDTGLASIVACAGVMLILIGPGVAVTTRGPMVIVAEVSATLTEPGVAVSDCALVSRIADDKVITLTPPTPSGNT